MDKIYGLIGRKLSHSFSKRYFTEKFEAEQLDSTYQLFELSDISEFPKLVRDNNLSGLNITIPYKSDILTYVDRIDSSAEKIGAVNVLKFGNEGITGYNSDYYGFRQSLINWIGSERLEGISALVCGTGGAAKAVCAVLDDLDIEFLSVSRNPGEDQIDYNSVDHNILTEHKLVINTTPLGMHPNTETLPNLPYENMTSHHWVYDLIYNPEKTSFMISAEKFGALTKNGLEMLHLQAEKSWEIWNS